MPPKKLPTPSQACSKRSIDEAHVSRDEFDAEGAAKRLWQSGPRRLLRGPAKFAQDNQPYKFIATGKRGQLRFAAAIPIRAASKPSRFGSRPIAWPQLRKL